MVDKNMKLFDGVTTNAANTAQAIRDICGSTVHHMQPENGINCITVNLVCGKAKIINCKDYNFMCSDIRDLLRANNIEANIVHILNYDSEQEKKYFNLDNFCSMFTVDTVILTTAYVSTEEFPEDEWYLDKPEPGLKKIPVDDVIKRECDLLEAVGFININKLVGYESKEAYVYGNAIGRKIANIANAL